MKPTSALDLDLFDFWGVAVPADEVATGDLARLLADDRLYKE